MDQFEIILKVVNAINEYIQFTLEVPHIGKPLHFLDLAITVEEQRIGHTWYSKECHSEITLKPDSWLPKHVKLNFISNSVKQVANKCSDEQMKSLALKKLKNRLQSNGFKSINVHKISNNSKKVAAKEDGVFLQTGFINDRFNKKVNKILKQYSFPIKAIFKPNRKLSHCFRPKNIKQKHENCNICTRLPEKYNCDDRFIVYKFTCNLCQKFYIGETCRPLRFRYEEHKRSLEKNDKKSALSEHPVTVQHPLYDFHFSFINLRYLSLDAVSTRTART